MIRTMYWTTGSEQELYSKAHLCIVGRPLGTLCRSAACVPSGDEPARDVRRPNSGASVEVDATGAALPPTVGPLAARGVLGSSSGGAGDVAGGWASLATGEVARSVAVVETLGVR